MPLPDEHRLWDQEMLFDTDVVTAEHRIPVVIDISDPGYEDFVSRVPVGSRAQAAVYGNELQQLAVVRKTLLRMSAWMNYLSPLS